MCVGGAVKISMGNFIHDPTTFDGIGGVKGIGDFRFTAKRVQFPMFEFRMVRCFLKGVCRELELLRNGRLLSSYLLVTTLVDSYDMPGDINSAVEV